jgi:hypothetical protein
MFIKAVDLDKVIKTKPTALGIIYQVRQWFIMSHRSLRTSSDASRIENISTVYQWFLHGRPGIMNPVTQCR